MLSRRQSIPSVGKRDPSLALRVTTQLTLRRQIRHCDGATATEAISRLEYSIWWRWLVVLSCKRCIPSVGKRDPSLALRVTTQLTLRRQIRHYDGATATEAISRLEYSIWWRWLVVLSCKRCIPSVEKRDPSLALRVTRSLRFMNLRVGFDRLMKAGGCFRREVL